MKPNKRHFTIEQKRAAVEAYVSGGRRAAEVAAELNISQRLLYKWRVTLGEMAKGQRTSELEAEGHSPEQARRILELEGQLAEYQKKVGDEAWQIVFLLDADERVRDLVVHKNCCYR